MKNGPPINGPSGFTLLRKSRTKLNSVNVRSLLAAKTTAPQNLYKALHRTEKMCSTCSGVCVCVSDSVSNSQALIAELEKPKDGLFQ